MNSLNHNAPTKASPAEVKTALSERMEPLCRALIPDKPKRCGNELRYGTNGSLAVCIAGDKSGVWHDHEADAGGGPIDLIMREHAASFPEAMHWAVDWLRGAIYAPIEPRRAPVLAEVTNTNTERALALWRDCEPLAGSPAEVYLNSRALQCEPSLETALRYYPSLYGVAYGDGGVKRKVMTPALVALVRDIVTGEPKAIERRYLTQDGQKHPMFNKAKALGSTGGGAVMLTGFKVSKGLNVCEGVEDALSVMALGYDGGAWAICGTSGLSSFPVVDHIPALRIWADNDRAGIAQADACQGRWRSAGRVANWQTMPAPYKDVNAYLMAMGGAHA